MGQLGRAESPAFLSMVIMKYLFLICAIAFFPFRGYSQQEKDSLNQHRWKDSVPTKDVQRREIFKLTGDLRYRGVFIKNEDFGESQKQKELFSLFRVLVGAWANPVKPLSFYLQLQSSLINSKEYGISPVDKNELDIHQAYVDYKVGKFKFRLGRQELSYGSQRLVSVREIPNNRQAFDGGKITFKDKRLSADLFHTSYVRSKEGILNDKVSPQIKFWGGYLSQKSSSGKSTIDIYYLGLDRQATLANAKGRETRHSFGSRFAGEASSSNFDMEGVYQFGTIGNSQISAWTLSSYISRKFKEVKLRPIVELKTDLISGDKLRNRAIGTFNALFPKGAYFGLAAIIGPSNLMDIHPSVIFELKPEKISLSLESLFLWRYSLNDGIYAANASMIYDASNSTKSYIGTQFAETLNYTPAKHILLRAELTFFKAGDFLKDAGPGKNVVFAALTSQIKF